MLFDTKDVGLMLVAIINATILPLEQLNLVLPKQQPNPMADALAETVLLDKPALIHQWIVDGLEFLGKEAMRGEVNIPKLNAVLEDGIRRQREHGQDLLKNDLERALETINQMREEGKI